MIVTLLKYWYVWLVGVSSTGMFILLALQPQDIITAIVGMSYALLLMGVYYRIYQRSAHKITIAITLGLSLFGFFGLFVLIEDSTVRRLVGAIAVVAMSALVYIPQHFTARLAHEYKPWRRMFVSIITIALYAFTTTLYGLDMFFQAPGIIWYGLLSGGISGLVSYAIFRMYHVEHTTRMLVWAMAIGWLAGQLFIVLSTLTFGYLLLGGVYMVLWYTGVIFVRFYLSPKGIVWRRQRVFLASIIILLFLLFIFAKWL